MNAKVESGETRFDGLKWLVVFALILGGAIGNSYFADDVTWIVRVVVLVAIGLAAAFVAVNTAKGQAFWTLLKEAQTEIRKVVWPTHAETNQTSLLVTIVVIITAILLWFLDWGISLITQMIIG